MGLWAFIVCFHVSCVGLVAFVIGLVRLGSRFARAARGCLLGSGLVWGGYIAAIGVLEKTWTLRSEGFWIAGLCGCAGVWLIAVGARKSAGRRFGPGQCRRCGYELGGASPCPECGASVPRS